MFVIKEARINEIEKHLSDLLDQDTKNKGVEFETPIKSEFAFVAYYQNEIIGGITAKNFLGEMKIELLAIRSDYQKQGVGGALIQKVKESARKEKCHHLLLNTFSYQAPNFYLKNGFEQLAKIDNFPKEGLSKYTLIYFL
ncbi:GNAT family N-acetyltransferase [Enterococcus rivorum]|uniref:N-acetyltransferase domain-containing protein n=1 Tax=Enterococcus rivorum TaxID=762845 RepID=A0A1E5KT48_9ENTE|nr:GNAT family N-acetyltransferase [Enterococcus rivorum]MBP2098120.1 N-acetylglutamate synthase-like GNAT family acetyltransferase [Enterococcus rivorum]OEH81057.1 hypothetical protein BCR26_05985 [Enterococcus rivorum]